MLERLFADTKLAQKTFSWSPEYKELDGFRKGLEKTIEWFSREENLKFYKPNIYNI